MTHLARIVILAVALAGAVPAHAISIDLVPSQATFNAGDIVTVDVVISGSTANGPPSVGTFDLDVAYDSGLLGALGVAFGLLLGDPGLFEALTDFNLLAGTVDLAELSLLTPAELDALQPDTFALATLTFIALAPGEASFEFTQVIVDDAFGNLLIGNKVPEPATPALLLGALVLLAARTFRGQWYPSSARTLPRNT